MNRKEEIVSSQEFSDVRDKWMVVCAVMMSKGYLAPVARSLYFSLKAIKEQGYSEELYAEFDRHFKAIKYGMSKEYKSIIKKDDLSQAFVKAFLLLTNKTTLLLEERQEIPDDFINRVENKMSDKARSIYIDNFA
jgi:hypothetical protein